MAVYVFGEPIPDSNRFRFAATLERFGNLPRTVSGEVRSGQWVCIGPHARSAMLHKFVWELPIVIGPRLADRLPIPSYGAVKFGVAAEGDRVDLTVREQARLHVFTASAPGLSGSQVVEISAGSTPQLDGKHALPAKSGEVRWTVMLEPIPPSQ